MTQPDWGVLPLAETDGKYLQQSVDAGGQGHGYYASADSGNGGHPSLEGSSRPQGTAHGIGGTVVPMGGSQTGPAASMAQGQSGPHAHAVAPLTPAQMMVMADEAEQGFLEQRKAAENPYGSSMEHYIDRPTAIPGHDSHVPEWLHEYMDKQPHTDPYHQVPMNGMDAIKSNKYLTERERLKYLKSLKDQGKF